MPTRSQRSPALEAAINWMAGEARWAAARRCGGVARPRTPCRWRRGARPNRSPPPLIHDCQAYVTIGSAVQALHGTLAPRRMRRRRHPAAAGRSPFWTKAKATMPREEEARRAATHSSSCGRARPATGMPPWPSGWAATLSSDEDLAKTTTRWTLLARPRSRARPCSLGSGGADRHDPTNTNARRRSPATRAHATTLQAAGWTSGVR